MYISIILSPAALAETYGSKMRARPQLKTTFVNYRSQSDWLTNGCNIIEHNVHIAGLELSKGGVVRVHCGRKGAKKRAAHLGDLKQEPKLD